MPVDPLEKEREERNRRIAIIGGMIIVISVLFAAVAIYTSGGGTSVARTTLTVAAGTSSVVVGRGAAPVKVTIYEDFGSADSAALEAATRDYLRENAAGGKVQVTYQPIVETVGMTYPQQTLNAWSAVLDHGTPSQALKLYDLFFEDQPAAPAAENASDDALAALVAKAGATEKPVKEALSVLNTGFLTAVHRAAVAAGVTSTPTVILNGRRLVATNVDDLATQIESAVDAAS